MTPEAAETMRKAIGLLRHPFSFILPLTLRPYRHRDAWHLWVFSPIPCIEPGKPMMLKTPRFIGVHECLCITLLHPLRIKSLVQVSRELPTIEPFGPVNWLAYTGYNRYSVTTRQGFIFHIPSYVYTAFLDTHPHPIKTKGVVHNLWVGTHEYFILEIPILQRKYIIPEEVTCESTESVGNYTPTVSDVTATGNG